MKKILTPVAVLVATTCAAFAQGSSASVVGRVTDPTGGVIPGVSIRITNIDTNIVQQGSSNGVGDYTIPYLAPGRYSLDASISGFRSYKRTELTLTVDQVLRMDITLEVGGASETVTITDDPPVLNTDSGSRGEVTTNEEIVEIPLDGRNFSDLAYLTGGVIPKGDGGDGAYAVNGARADNIGFLVDGMNNTQRRNTGAVINPPLEGVQEFKMITSGFNAEYGRYAGGVLSAITRSGTNRLRGTLSEFIRNDMWDARGYFDVEKSKLRQNRFGATLSGPVVLPKIYDGRNKTFFLFSWESLRSVAGKTQRGIVPSAGMLNGDFSKAVDAFGKPITITDTLAKAPFPNNRIPSSRFDPVAVKLASLFPSPNLAGVNNYISQGNSTGSNNNFGVKVDHSLSSADRLTFATFWRPNTSWDPIVNGRSPLPQFGLGNNTLDLLTYIRWVRSITPTLYLEANASFSRKTNDQKWPYSAEKDWAGEIGFLGGTQNPVARGLPQVDTSGYITLGPAYDYPKIWSFNNYQYSANLTWIHGRHSFKYGADFLRMQYFSRQYGDTRGRLSFLGRFTGDPMADFMLGWLDSSRRQLDAAGPYHLISNYSAFVQDDFKVSPTLTLNMGLRYELMKPPKEKFGAWSMFVPSVGKVVIAGKGNIAGVFDQRIKDSGISQYITSASDAGLPPTITRTDWTNFAPRFGFAWRPFGGNRNVIRGGYGIFYGSSSLYRMDEYSDVFPFSINESYSRNSTNPLLVTVSNPFQDARRSIGGVNNTYGQDAEPQTQYLQSWNLTVERQFGPSTVLEVGYAGSKGTHLQRRYDINQPYREQALRSLRPYAGFGTIQIISDGSNSIYNSGAVTLRRHFSKQTFVRVAYTYSKSIDETSNTGGTIQYNFPIAQDSRNLRGERGRSDFDTGHSFAASFIWAPNASRHVLLRDWQLAGTSTMYTGQPFTPKVANYNYTNGEASRPDRIAKGTLANPTVDQWFDRSAFPVVPLGAYRFGNSGRNILDGPGTINVNVSMSRRIRFGESKALQFRMESFNLLNHPNFNLPENRVDIISGGSISRVKGNRVLQSGLRLEF